MKQKKLREDISLELYTLYSELENEKERIGLEHLSQNMVFEGLSFVPTLVGSGFSVKKEKITHKIDEKKN